MFFTDHTIRHQRDLVHVEAQVSILIGLPGFSEVLNKHKKNRTNKTKSQQVSSSVLYMCGSVPDSCDGICRDPWQRKNSSSSLEPPLENPSADR